jgi:hypothetical protein
MESSGTKDSPQHFEPSAHFSEKQQGGTVNDNY